MIHAEPLVREFQTFRELRFVNGNSEKAVNTGLGQAINQRISSCAQGHQNVYL